MTKTIEWQRVVRGGTIDYPYEDTWEETVTEYYTLEITPEIIADYINKDWRKLGEGYLQAIKDMLEYAYDEISDFVDYNEYFQEYLKDIAVQKWNEDHRK